jgi:hypothetical protein
VNIAKSALTPPNTPAPLPSPEIVRSDATPLSDK